MKKKYIQPVVMAIDIEVNTMLCVSATLSNETQNNDAALSRGFDFSEDYDFDEE